MYRSEMLGMPSMALSHQQVLADKPPLVRGGLNRAEGPLVGSDRGLLYSLTQCGPTLGNSMFGPETPMVPEEHTAEFAAADMSLSTLYMHELHHRQVRNPRFSLKFVICYTEFPILFGSDEASCGRCLGDKQPLFVAEAPPRHARHIRDSR